MQDEHHPQPFFIHGNLNKVGLGARIVVVNVPC
jgi:hypothetical protein